MSAVWGKLGLLRGNFVVQDFMDVRELGLLAEGLTELLSAVYEVRQRSIRVCGLRGWRRVDSRVGVNAR